MTTWTEVLDTKITGALSAVGAGQTLIDNWIDITGNVWSATTLWSDTSGYYLSSIKESTPWSGGPLYRPQSEDGMSQRITASYRVDENQTVWFMLRANRSTTASTFNGYLVAIDSVAKNPYIHIFPMVGGSTTNSIGSSSVSGISNLTNGELVTIDIQLDQVTDTTSQIVVSVTDSSGNAMGSYDSGTSNTLINTTALQNVAGSVGLCVYGTQNNTAGVKEISVFSGSDSSSSSDTGAVIPWSGYTVTADNAQIAVNGTATLTVAPTPLTTNTFYNWDTKNQLQNYITKLAALKAGTLTTQFRVCAAGDSTTVGVGTGTGSSGVTGCRLNGYPAQLAQQLETAGLRVSYDNFFGSGNEPDADSRVSFVGGGAFGGVSSLGANAITLTAAGDGFVFTTGSTKTYNQITVVYVDYGSKGTFTVQVDDQAVQTAAAIANSGVVKSQTFSITEGTIGTVTVMGSGSGQQFFCGVICEHSTQPYMTICNLGIAGGTTYQIVGPVDTAWSKYNSVTAMVDMVPDLVLVNTGINDDITDATSAQKFLGQMSATLEALVAQNSPVILAVYQPINRSDYATGIVAWRAALEAFSDAQNIPLLDLSNEFGNSPTSSGYAMFNNLHPTEATYGKIAAVWAERLLDPANDVIAQRKITVTPSDNSGGGTFSPTTVEFDAGSNATKTLTYTGKTAGTKSITGTNSGSLTNPAALSLVVGASGATKYTLTGPSSLTVGTAGTFTLTPDAAPTTAVVVTLTSTLTGAFSSPTVTLPAGSTAAQTVTFTASAAGSGAISATNNGSLTNPAALTVTAQTAAVTATKYTLTGPASLTVGSAGTYTLTPDAAPAADVVVTLTSTVTGAFSSTTVTFKAGSTATQTVTFTPSTAGSGTISATNNGGLTNPAAVTVTAQTTATKPGVPTFSLKAGNGTITVTVVAPASNGGATITGYPIYVGTSSGGESTTPVTTLSAAGSYVISNLTNGSPAYVTVGATNAMGTTVAAEQSATPMVPSAGGLILVDNPAFLFSPGNWYGDAGRTGSSWRRTWNVGAYFVFTWTASASPTAVLHLGPSTTGAYVTLYLNGVASTVAATGDITLSNITPSAENVLFAILDYTPQQARWNQGSNNLLVSGLTLDAASASGTSVAGSKGWVKIIGDSITEGIEANNNKNEIVYSYSFQVLQSLRLQGYEVCISACGYSGYLIPGDSTGDVPAYYYVTGSNDGTGGIYTDSQSRWNKIDANVSALDSNSHLSSYGDADTEPAAIAINYLTNEALSGANPSDAQAAMTQAMIAHRAAAPTAWLFMIMPFGFYYSGKYNASWLTVFNNAVQAYRAAYPGDNRVTVIDIGSDLSNTIQKNKGWYISSSDDVHPLAPGHALIAPIVQSAMMTSMESRKTQTYIFY
ncbi:GDSL-type esterase/lipase family protein [Acetobacter sp.]|uniref:GDSL-type esterase/lipase family protein n=1 Tax=Acetobacter sp. TaxID=440 RepID=UPI0039ED1DEB